MRYEPLEGGGKGKVFRALIPENTTYIKATFSIVPEGSARASTQAAYQLFDASLPAAMKALQSLQLTKPLEESMTLYHEYDVDYGYAIEYPKTWKRIDSHRAQTESGVVTLVTFKAPGGSVVISDRGFFFEPFDEYYKNVQEYNSAMNDFYAAVKEYEKSDPSTVKSKKKTELLSTERVIHHGDEAYRAESIITEGGLVSKNFEILLLHNNRIYSVEYSAPIVAYDRYIASVKKFLQSFQFPFPSQPPDVLYEDKQTGTHFLIPSSLKRSDMYEGLRVNLVINRCTSAELVCLQMWYDEVIILHRPRL